MAVPDSLISIVFSAGLFSLPLLVSAQSNIDELIRDGEFCLSSGGGSRIESNCDGEKTTVLRSEAEVTTRTRLQTPVSTTCGAEMELEYAQWNTLARVQGEVNNAMCAASAGSFEILATVRHEDGELATLTFAETWARVDDRPVTFARDYSIGENVELIRIRSRRLRCRCQETD